MVNKESYPMRFLVKAPNAEEAKVLSEAFYETYMRVAEDDKELPPYTMTLLSAKTLNVEAVIDHQFCKEYIDKSKENVVIFVHCAPRLESTYVRAVSGG